MAYILARYISLINMTIFSSCEFGFSLYLFYVINAMLKIYTDISRPIYPLSREEYIYIFFRVDRYLMEAIHGYLLSRYIVYIDIN